MDVQVPNMQQQFGSSDCGLFSIAFMLHILHICLMRETFDDRVECEECEEWFHLKCMGLTQAPEEHQLWYCRKCAH